MTEGDFKGVNVFLPHSSPLPLSNFLNVIKRLTCGLFPAVAHTRPPQHNASHVNIITEYVKNIKKKVSMTKSCQDWPNKMQGIPTVLCKSLEPPLISLFPSS